MILRVLLVIVFLQLISCSKKEEVIVQVTEPKEISKPPLGVSRFGRSKINEQGIEIFKTSEGYLSFEYFNFYNAQSYPTGDLVVRRVDEQFETIDSILYQDKPFILIENIIRMGTESYVVLGNRKTYPDEPYNLPIITVFDDKGHEIKSLVVSDLLMEGGTSAASIKEATFIDNRLYVVLSENKGLTIVVLDTDLNLIWEKFEELKHTNYTITVDDKYLYFSRSIDESGVFFNTNYIHKLDIKTGEEVDRWSFIHSDSNYSVKTYPFKLLNDHENIYLVYKLHFPNESNIDPYYKLKRINKKNGEIIDLGIPEFNFLDEFELTKEGFIYSGSHRTDGKNIINADKFLKDLWVFEVVGGSRIKDIKPLENGEFVFSGFYVKGIEGNNDLYDDALIGGLKANGTIK
ncbi:hypothetical protein [Cytophaga sp. FL35]|uniref:hypothetical protein n=1 Tax=Cytophaga sp. FL35 TaxID=1904456 RepID=UPI001653A566|nr:hypothetical protein [Cytophaga sp. FL35]MBC6999947.1 hypothetical protein [Cytophaga sp. FL35]